MDAAHIISPINKSSVFFGTGLDSAGARPGGNQTLFVMEHTKDFELSMQV